jgi:hypothetical protein
MSDLLNSPTITNDVISTPKEDVNPLENSNSKKPRKSTAITNVDPKWKQDAINRLRTTIKRYSKSLIELIDQQANEAQTRLLVTEFLCEGLGFDRFSDLDVEFQVRGKFVDYGLRVDRQLVAFVEVKSAATKLLPKHLQQVKNYVLDDPDVEWAILTNGSIWQIYHIEAAKPIDVALILEIDLIGDTAKGHRASKLVYITHEAFKHDAISELWRKYKATTPETLASALLSLKVIRSLRAEVHTLTGHLVDPDELGKQLRESVIRPEIIC